MKVVQGAKIDALKRTFALVGGLHVGHNTLMLRKYSACLQQV